MNSFVSFASKCQDSHQESPYEDDLRILNPGFPYDLRGSIGSVNVTLSIMSPCRDGRIPLFTWPPICSFNLSPVDFAKT